MVIGRLDLGAFPDYKDDCYEHEDCCALIDYGFLGNAYEDIFMNLGGENQAEAFLRYTEEHEHGTFVGDGYEIEF